MYVMSFLGDGEPYFYAIMLNWAYSKWNRYSTYMYDTNYFLLVFLSSNCVCQVLKSLFSHSRPYFDDITLGDIVFKDCATEYGNPSGHSQMAITMTLVPMMYYLEIYKAYFERNPVKKTAIKMFGWFYIISVAYSRIYLGRHTLDQCLHGLAIGYLCYHFAHHYWRKEVFDHEIKDDADHNRHIKLYMATFLSFLGMAVAEFIYIEYYTDGIPPQFLKNAEVICTRLT